MSDKELDLGKTRIIPLFFQYFVPTFLSMVSSAVLNLADGIFVGRGVGSDALAAVNVAAPVFLIATSLSLLLGSGASVMAALRLSQDDAHKASIYVTNAFLCAIALLVALCISIFVFAPEMCFLFGGSDILLPYVCEYMRIITPGMFCFGISIIGMFIIRLDGSPRYSMLTNVLPAILNIVLDYIFVFPLQMGVAGAASALSISVAVGLFMVLGYFVFYANKIHLCRLRPTLENAVESVRQIWQMFQIGFPTFLGEAAISIMMIVGNILFMDMLGEDGVAAFGVACYLTPTIFMFGSAIAQSLMPIVSFNHGQGNTLRVRQTIKLSIASAFAFGIAASILTSVYSAELSSMFLKEGGAAIPIVTKGLPLFAFGLSSLTINLVIIACVQSMVMKRASTIFMLLRGYVIMLPVFYFVPKLLGEPGLWLAMPASETITLFLIVLWWIAIRKK